MEDFDLYSLFHIKNKEKAKDIIRIILLLLACSIALLFDLFMSLIILSVIEHFLKINAITLKLIEFGIIGTGSGVFALLKFIKRINHSQSYPESTEKKDNDNSNNSLNLIVKTRSNKCYNYTGVIKSLLCIFLISLIFAYLGCFSPTISAKANEYAERIFNFEILEIDSTSTGDVYINDINQYIDDLSQTQNHKFLIYNKEYEINDNLYNVACMNKSLDFDICNYLSNLYSNSRKNNDYKFDKNSQDAENIFYSNLEKSLNYEFGSNDWDLYKQSENDLLYVIELQKSYAEQAKVSI